MEGELHSTGTLSMTRCSIDLPFLLHSTIWLALGQRGALLLAMLSQAHQPDPGGRKEEGFGRASVSIQEPSSSRLARTPPILPY